MHKGLKQTVRVLAVFLMVVLSLALLVDPAISQTKPAQKSTPQYGGTLKIISRYPAVNLGIPWEPSVGDDITYNAPAVETLMFYDRQGKAIPWLATSWKVSKDLKTLTLSLRKGVKFHDGTDFDAEAVKFCLDNYRTSGKAELKDISAVDVIDPYTVRLTFNTRFQAHILNSLGGSPGMIVSPTAIKNHDKAWAMKNPIGTGPFKITKYERDLLVRYEKFPDYWQKGKPYLDAIEFHFISDPLSCLAAFKTGDGDQMVRIDVQDALDLQATGKFLLDKVAITVTGLGPDGGNAKSPFADVRVRKAVEYAIDKVAVTRDLYRGLFAPATQIRIPSAIGYNPAVKGYPYDPKKAKELLTQAGYPNGFKTKIIYRTADDEKLFVAMQGYLKAVGIDAALEPITMQNFAQMINVGWENSMVRWYIPAGIDMHPGQAILRNMSRQATLHKSIARSDLFETKLSKAVDELDERKGKVLFEEISKIVSDQELVCPIYIHYAISARTSRVQNQGAGIHQVFGATWTPADAWLSK
jgi:peptide/nickel transport system substrate-binding protein